MEQYVQLAEHVFSFASMCMKESLQSEIQENWMFCFFVIISMEEEQVSDRDLSYYYQQSVGA